MANLDAIAGLGVRLSIADFGTGILSITRLQRLPLQALKLDRHVLLDIENAKCLALLSCLVGIGESLSIEVTAEGVQTRIVWELLRKRGCTALQGPAVSGPRAAADLEQWMRDSWPTFPA